MSCRSRVWFAGRHNILTFPAHGGRAAPHIASSLFGCWSFSLRFHLALEQGGICRNVIQKGLSWSLSLKAKDTLDPSPKPRSSSVPKASAPNPKATLCSDSQAPKELGTFKAGSKKNDSNKRQASIALAAIVMLSIDNMRAPTRPQGHQDPGHPKRSVPAQVLLQSSRPLVAACLRLGVFMRV